MMNTAMKPILSVVIPTYNRASLLSQSLERLTSESAFRETDEVEIVVSDNASTDETQRMCEEYVNRFPGKFVYYRQSENKGYSENVATLMRLASGEYIKFNCDTFYYLPGEMAKAVALIKRWRDEKPVMFFRNDHLLHYQEGVYVEDTFDGVLEVNSFLPMWTGGFGLWREEREEALKVHYQTADTMIPQVAVFWRLFDLRRKAVIHNYRNMGEIWPPNNMKKAIGNRAEIFGKYYLDILRPYCQPGKISNQAYEKEKKRLFFCAIYRPYFDFFHEFIPTRSGFLRYTSDYYKNTYYWIFLGLVPLFYLIGMIPRNLSDPMRRWYKNVKENLLR